MGSRRDNRSSVSGPTAVVMHHAKQHHDRRNHELLKRLASDSTSSYPVSQSITTTKTPPSKGVGGGGGSPVMSKSLTLVSGKGHHDQESPVGKARTRRKADMEKSLQSLQRQTSSSAMKMSLSLNDKEQFVDNKTSKVRDLSPAKRKSQVRDPAKMTKKKEAVNGRSGNPDKKVGTAIVGEHIKRAAVFERLSRQECNKGVVKSELGSGNRIRDRSPAKNGRKSPQEGKVTSDKNLSSRNISQKTAPSRKRDGSPVKKEEKGRKTSSQGITGRRKITKEGIRNGSPDPEEDKDGSREKLEKDNIPESPDKDTKDWKVNDEDRIMITAASGLVNGNESSSSRQKEVGGSVYVGGCEEVKAPLSAPNEVKLGHPATQQGLLKGSITNTNKATSTKLSATKKTLEDKALMNKSKGSTSSANGQCKPTTFRKPDAGSCELSKAEVIQKVRQRVCDDKKDTKNVIDDDKDVCEGKTCEDDEFYKIKVQTRLVSYSNSTLVIKNTSKVDGVGDYAEDHSGDSELESSHPPSPSPSPPPPPSPHTLQTSSMAPPAVPDSDDVEANGAYALPTESHPGDVSPFTRSRSMRDKFSQFVSKGKNFLSDVYSATQTKLEHYTKGDSPYSSTCSSISSSITSLEEEKIPRRTTPRTSDSGYFSINTSPEVIQPAPREVSTSEDKRLHNGTCANAIRADQTSPKILLAADGGLETPYRGTKIAGNVTPPDFIGKTDSKYAKTIETANVNDEDDDVDELPAIPPPHKNFTLNEDWIKKNILCTCKCKRNANKTKTVDSPVSVNQNDEDKKSIIADATSIEKLLSVEDNIVDSSSEVCVNSDIPTETLTKDLDDLCLCSCHDGEDGQRHQEFPQEVLDILDADHARMWWTITGNFGSILPIDWSKTYTRQQYLPVLNLNETKEATNTTEETERSAEDDAEEEEVAQDLDLHHLILNGLSAEPVKSAEEVIREIDDIMQEGSSSEDEGVEETSTSGANSNESPTHPLPPPLYAEKLNNMSIGELNEAFMELEIVIRQYSETLINQLALRDELEYEKELKNSFISLLLQVQNKRRNFNVEKKKQKKYLTTVIPYDVGHGPPQNETLQILIKILMAINEDSPTVPTLLTDYILKVLCPS